MSFGRTEFNAGTKLPGFMVLMSVKKFTLAKMFGLGKSSRAKPGPLLEAARSLYDILKTELQETDDD